VNNNVLVVGMSGGVATVTQSAPQIAASLPMTRPSTDDPHDKRQSLPRDPAAVANP
jgi:hypothetical protein